MSGEQAQPQTPQLHGGDSLPFQPQQELRLAVVLYGGVSLAIYMYGVAQELFNLVWSTAPSESFADDGEPPPRLARDRTESTDAVYRKLGQLLPLEDCAGGDGVGAPVRTRFVVDIISGTSAGGINGICLAKALAEEADLEGLKQVWLKEGDISVLINDGECGYPDSPPASLLSGKRMLDKLVGAIRGMKPSRNGASRLVDELDLWVTATDLEGLEVPIQIANATAIERRHANRYHFRHSPEDERYDFDGTVDGFIAYAARSTSAFPFAFAPVLLDDLGDDGPVPDDAWERFYTAYAATEEPPFTRRAFSDGGILDNKPFSYATDTLLNRHASLPVDRKVVYVEPDPGGMSDLPPRETWSAMDTTRSALLGLPQLENIREDVQTVLQRNRTIERVRDIVAHAGSTEVEQEPVEELAQQKPSEDWAEQGLSDTPPAQGGPAYGVYYRLKVRGIVDYLASLVVSAAGFDPGSDEDFAVHYLVRAWKESEYASEPGGGRLSENAFLLDFDLPYRLRRLDFLLERVKELRSGDPEVITRVLAACGVQNPGPVLEAERRDELLLDLRRELSAARREVRKAQRRLVHDGRLAEALRRLGIGRDQLASVLDRRSDEAMLARARELVPPGSFDEVAELIRAGLEVAAGDLRGALEAVFDVPENAEEAERSLRRALRFAHATFEAYDLPLYLVGYGTPVGETNPVEVVRVSPREADGPKGSKRDLRGLRLHHFGAFLDERWRAYDMVWGRLDGAECLIRAMLPEDHPRADGLVRAAHRQILEEYRDELDEATDDDVFKWFNEHEVAQDPDRESTAAALNRGAVVMSHLVEQAVRQGGAGGQAGKVAEGVREAMTAGDEAPAVDAVLGIARSNPWFGRAIVAWAFFLFLGTGLLFLGDIPRVAGLLLLGALLPLAAFALSARPLVGRAVRGARARARRAAYKTFFPHDAGTEGQGDA